MRRPSSTRRPALSRGAFDQLKQLCSSVQETCHYAASSQSRGTLNIHNLFTEWMCDEVGGVPGAWADAFLLTGWEQMEMLAFDFRVFLHRPKKGAKNLDARIEDVRTNSHGIEYYQRWVVRSIIVLECVLRERIWAVKQPATVDCGCTSWKIEFFLSIFRSKRREIFPRPQNANSNMKVKNCRCCKKSASRASVKFAVWIVGFRGFKIAIRC